MPIRTSSPKAVQAAMKALAAAVLAAGVTAVPAAAFTPSASDAAQAQSTSVAFAPGVSDAAQTHATRVAFTPGLSDAAQRSPGETTPVIGAPATRTVTVADDGFDWSSGLIGAGGAAGLLVVCAGGALAITPRRRAVGHA